MDTIQHLNLTEKDFDMIVEGLEHLPNKDEAGELMTDMLMGILSKDKSEKDKVLAERKAELIKKKDDQRLLKEDIKILQGKLLMLKRFLTEQGALKEAVNIINHVS